MFKRKKPISAAATLSPYQDTSEKLKKIKYNFQLSCGHFPYFIRLI